MDPISSLISGGLSAGASLIGGWMTNKQNSGLNYQNNLANYMLQMQNQAWAQQMRATQYQTAVQDMKKAGLNPAMMYGGGGAGGAGVPNVGSSTMQAAHMENTVGPAVEKTLAAMRLSNENELAKASVAKNVQDVATSAAQAENIKAQTDNQKLVNLVTIPEAIARIAQATGSAKAAQASVISTLAGVPGIEAGSELKKEELKDFKWFGKDPMNLGAARRAAITALEFGNGLTVNSAQAANRVATLPGAAVPLGLRRAAGLTPKFTNRAQ